jgi:leucyl aminopeptidase
VRVTGLMPIAENAIGGDALRPGDVITHWGGRTTEVTNTDAEGRLVMADALQYAATKLKPDLLVDVATLTGAMKVALGLRTGGYFATDDAAAAHLETASADSGERMWRMPLAEIYEPLLDSRVADPDNAPGRAGAITAALFLQHFTGGLPWLHLDIASVGDSLGESFEWTKGPTGFGVRLLLHWLGSAAPLEGVGR